MFESELTDHEKRDIGIAYIDFMQESAMNVAQIKAVQSKLREANILNSVNGNAAAATET